MTGWSGRASRGDEFGNMAREGQERCVLETMDTTVPAPASIELLHIFFTGSGEDRTDGRSYSIYSDI